MKIAAGDEGAVAIAPKRPAVTARGLVGALTTPAILVILWAGVLMHGWTIFSAMRTRMRNFDFSIYYASALARTRLTWKASEADSGSKSILFITLPTRQLSCS